MGCLKHNQAGNRLTTSHGAARPSELFSTGVSIPRPCLLSKMEQAAFCCDRLLYRRQQPIEEDKQRQHGIISPYLFVNPQGHKKGRHYTLKILEKIWDRAAEAVGEDIGLYQGTKHSTASQLINERGFSQSELQMAGDWSRLESVKKYGKLEVSARKTLLEGKIVSFGTKSELNQNSKS